MGTKLQPWTSWQEWEDVGCLLLRRAPEAVTSSIPSVNEVHAITAEGVERVRAWRLRGRVPLSLDVTACLVEAQLQDTTTLDMQQARACGGLSDVTLRGMYALPIIRLVNGVADAQQRGRVASSVASLASNAGLPPLLVDVRHAATHGELPSLQLLRLAADRALAWLETAYWEAQAAQLAGSHSRLVGALSDLHSSWLAAHTKGTGAAQGDGNEDLTGDEGEAEGEEDMEPVAAGYSSVDGKAARRAALSELRGQVPGAWSAALLHPLVTALTHTLPATGPLQTGDAPGHVGEEASGKPPSKKKRRSEGALSGMACALAPPTQPTHQATGAASAASKALNSCLNQLFRAYPSLGHQLAACCVYTLSARCHGTDSTDQQPVEQQPHTIQPLSLTRHKQLTQQYAQAAAGLIWWPGSVSTAARASVPTELQSNSAQVPQQQLASAPARDTISATTTPVPDALPTAHAWAWLRLLLPAGGRGGQAASTARSDSGPSKKRQHGAGPGPGSASNAAGLPLQLSILQLMELLGAALHGLSSSSLTRSEPQSADRVLELYQADASTQDVLRWVVTVVAPQLDRQLGGAGSATLNPGQLAKARGLIQLASLTTPNQHSLRKAADPTPAMTLDEMSARQSELLAANATTVPGRRTASRQPAQPPIAAGQPAASGSCAPLCRWRLADDWQPSALGCLPSACVPSGHVPVLILPHEATVRQEALHHVGAAPHGADGDWDVQARAGVDEGAVDVGNEGDVQEIAAGEQEPIGSDVDGEMGDEDGLSNITTGGDAMRVGVLWANKDQLQQIGAQVGFLI